MSAFEWLPSNGQDAHWIGGPKVDHTDGNAMGGYAFFETSQLPMEPDATNTVSAMMASPVLEPTGAKGHCVSFSYAMDGLSVAKLRIILQPVKDNKEVIEQGAEAEQAVRETMHLDFSQNQVIATLKDGTRGLWKAAQVMYSSPVPHKVCSLP